MDDGKAGGRASIVDCFSSIEDPRIERTKKHKLIDILVIAICAVICHAETWEDIEEFGKAKFEWFRRFLELPNGIPSHDTFARLFSRLDTKRFHECFLNWIRAVSEFVDEKIISIDGKTLRRSIDRASAKEALHLVSAWSNQNQLVLGQVRVASKSNEITAIPRLLQILDIKGCLITIDAMGCQKEIARQIIEDNGEYVLALKGNQGGLHDDVKTNIDGASEEILTQRFGSPRETTDGDHGRIEVRKYWLASDIDFIESRGEWKGLKSLGIAESQIEVKGEVKKERRYYIVSFAGDVDLFAKAVRGHWGIENSLHWTLDVSFREDASRIRKDNAPENFAILRRIALSLLRATREKRLSVKTKRLKAGWDNEFLMRVLFAKKDPG